MESLATILIDRVPIPLLVLDEELNVIRCNPQFLTEHSLREEDIRFQFFPELARAQWGLTDVKPRLMSLIAKLSSSLELDRRSANGGQRSLRITAQSVLADSRRALLIAVEDVSGGPNSNSREPQPDTDRAPDDGTDDCVRQLFSVQDEERRRVARELHDELGQQIGLLHLDVARLAKSVPPGAHALLTQSRTIECRVSNLAENVRRLAHQLHPSIIEDIGLPAALQHLARECSQRYEIPINLRADDSFRRIPLDVAANLYRIAQEALRNVSRHAGKTRVKMRLTVKGSLFRMVIRDFGDGFNMEDRGKFGLGLHSMRERALSIGGACEVQSRKNKGTTITVNVPLSETS
jgi:two-component system CheB/CheR fusion protein